MHSHELSIKSTIYWDNPRISSDCGGGGGGAVVKSIVSLTKSLRRQLVKYMPTTLPNTLLFFVGKITVYL